MGVCEESKVVGRVVTSLVPRLSPQQESLGTRLGYDIGVCEELKVAGRVVT